MKRYKFQEIVQIIGVGDKIIADFIREEWIVPASHTDEDIAIKHVEDATELDLDFDDEDLTRIRLILALMNDLGVNAEAVPIILGLIDQLHLFRSKIFSELPRPQR